MRIVVSTHIMPNKIFDFTPSCAQDIIGSINNNIMYAQTYIIKRPYYVVKLSTQNKTGNSQST